MASRSAASLPLALSLDLFFSEALAIGEQGGARERRHRQENKGEILAELAKGFFIGASDFQRGVDTDLRAVAKKRKRQGGR